MKRTSKWVVGILTASALGLVLATGAQAHRWNNTPNGGGQGMMGGNGQMGGYGMMGGHGQMGGYGMMGGQGQMSGRGMMGGPGMKGSGGMPWSAQNLDQLKTTLGIAQGQKAVWDNFVQAIEGRNQLMQAHHQTMASNQDSIDTESRLGMMKSGMAQMQATIEATENLYKALSPEQKASFDKLAGGGCAQRNT